MIKSAENIIKGDIIYLPDEEIWLKIEDVSEVNYSSFSSRILVWVTGDDIAIHYPRTQMVQYKVA